MYAGMLRALFEREEGHVFAAEFDEADVERIASFLAKVWQVHPFAEGNTRTVAVFGELYLRSLGLDVDNDPFATHVLWFRDALVRANYRNASVGVAPDLSFLVRFLGAVVRRVPFAGTRSELLCRPLFEHPDAIRNVSAADAEEVRARMARWRRDARA